MRNPCLITTHSQTQHITHTFHLQFDQSIPESSKVCLLASQHTHCYPNIPLDHQLVLHSCVLSQKQGHWSGPWEDSTSTAGSWDIHWSTAGGLELQSSRWPWSFAPQHETSPDSRMAQVCHPPDAMTSSKPWQGCKLKHLQIKISNK